MRRVQLLINDIRFNTNNTDDNRISDMRLVKFFNDAQDAIQAIVFMNDTDAKHFSVETFIDLQYGVEKYTLPSDIYANNSINSVARKVNEGSSTFFTPLRKTSEKERRKGMSYSVIGNQIVLSPLPKINLLNGIRLNYIQKLPKLSQRIGKIKSLSSGTSVTIDILSEGDISLFEDHFCIVDRFGVIKDSGLLIDSYNENTGKITTSSTIVNGAIGDYVVIGKRATSHAQLPENTEALLTSFVERRIQLVDSSSDINNADLFTEKEKELIIGLYSKNDHDAKYPTIVDETYLNE